MLAKSVQRQPGKCRLCRRHVCKNRARRDHDWLRHERRRAVEARGQGGDDLDRGARLAWRIKRAVEPLHPPWKLVKLPSSSGYAAIGSSWFAIWPVSLASVSSTSR